MSTPTEPAVDQPTQAYPPAQHTAAYPSPDQPTAVYGSAPMPPAPDTRPKVLGIVALIVAVVGVGLVALGFLPLVGVSFIFALLGGLVLLAALILGIVVLANKKQGGKGLGIAALVIAVLGGFAAIAAMVFSFVLVGLTAAAAAQESVTSSDVTTEDDATDEGTATDDEAVDDAPVAGAYDEEAYLAIVRPEILAIVQDAVPGISEEEVSAVYSDETLVMLGAPFVGLDDAAIEANREPFVSSMVGMSDGIFTDEHANRLYDAIVTAARQHLAE